MLLPGASTFHFCLHVVDQSMSLTKAGHLAIPAFYGKGVPNSSWRRVTVGGNQNTPWSQQGLVLKRGFLSVLGLRPEITVYLGIHIFRKSLKLIIPLQEAPCKPDITVP